MIIIRYLLKEIIKSQLAILFVLLMIVFCQKLVRILGSAVEGDIPVNLVISLLVLGFADVIQLILPLSLFLAILIIFGRLYMDSEMVALFACGIGKSYLVRVGCIAAILTTCLAMGNTLWLSPKLAEFQSNLLTNARLNPSVINMVDSQFQQFDGSNSVVYVGKSEKGVLSDIFVAHLAPQNKQQKPAIVVSKKGTVYEESNGNTVINLEQATSYEGAAGTRDFRITEFDTYKTTIKYREAGEEEQDLQEAQLSLTQLWAMRDSAKARVEFSWRITALVSVIIVALLAVPLSEINPRQGRFISVLPAIMLYFAYFLLQSSMRSNGLKGRLDPFVWMSAISCAYLVLALLLNIWDTLPLRRLRQKIRGIRNV